MDNEAEILRGMERKREEGGEEKGGTRGQQQGQLNYYQQKFTQNWLTRGRDIDRLTKYETLAT